MHDGPNGTEEKSRAGVTAVSLNLLSLCRELLLIRAPTRRHNGAGFLAAKHAAQDIAIAANPSVENLSDHNGPGNPEREGEGNRQWHPDADETKATRTAINFSASGHAMNSFVQIRPRKPRRNFMRTGIGNRQERHGVEPIQPRDEPRLKSAERTISVVKNNVGRAALIHAGSMRERRWSSMRHFIGG